MAQQRKLGRPADQRKALLRGQVSQLIWNGRITTTLARAKELRSIAEKFVTLAIREYDHTIEVEKTFNNDKGQTVTETFVNDLPSKLAARRRMMAYIYDIPEVKKADESKSDFKARTKDNKHPIIEKLFREYGPKYKARAEEKGQGGGYTRILKLGPRRGDGAEMVVLEFVD
ncbi:MAG: 50S ribosomal protein L17 [Christensenellaceae bacterium]|jgi:large subunit ribosomal protein L17|nr:50S ribosomal protein L17 [Christensenellaceae bacterium]